MRNILWNKALNTERESLAKNFGDSQFRTVAYIRVTRNSNEIPILNSSSSVGHHVHQLNEEKSISFIYMICFYFGFGIRSVISLLFTNTFANTKIV